MPRNDDEYDASRDYDPDDPETYPEGLYVDDDRDTVPCKQCKADIDEDAERCPECGYYVTSEEAATGGGKAKFLTVVMVLALCCAAFWVAAK